MSNSDASYVVKQKTKSNIVDKAAGIWLFTAILGQVAFFGYIAAFYALPAINGEIEAWNSNTLLNQPPVVKGHFLDTAAFGTHAIGAGIVALMGGLQLVPFIRNRFRTFHRWNGRLFVMTVVALSLSGYYIVWVRGPVPTSFSELGTSLNGALILGFAGLAVAAAIGRRFVEHERWAIRLYLVSNAQWFLRIGGFGYFFIAQSLGAEVAFDGWFFKFWIWGCFLVPLAISEVYFRTRRSDRVSVRKFSATFIIGCALLTIVGSLVFSVFSIQLIQGTVPA